MNGDVPTSVSCSTDPSVEATQEEGCPASPLAAVTLAFSLDYSCFDIWSSGSNKNRHSGLIPKIDAPTGWTGLESGALC